MKSECSVCVDPEIDENRIVVCKTCNVKVHMACYGVKEFEVNWKCSPCNMKKIAPICELCVQKGGAMKKTKSGKWVHVICSLFTDGVRFENEESMEPIDISNVSKSKRYKTCTFCKKSTGFCVLCHRYSCKNRLHITCAQVANCLREVTNNKDSMIKFRAFCAEHKPKSTRRISSQFVIGRILENTNIKQQQGQSSQVNLNWILEEVDKNSIEEPQSGDLNDAVKARTEKNTPQQKKDEEADMDTGDAHEQPINDGENVSGKKKKAKKRKNKEIEDGRMKRRSPSTEMRMCEIDPVSVVENEKQTSINQQWTADLESAALWWDTRDLRQENQFVNDLDDFEGTNSNKENIDSEHTCFKDRKIQKLKAKIEKMKNKLEKLEGLNTQLQEQILTVKADTIKDEPAQFDKGVLKVLSKRLVTQLSSDKSELIYPNGVKISVKKKQILDSIPTEPFADRPFINAQFSIIFSEKYLKKQMKKRLNRGEVLTKFRDSNRHAVMKDLFDYRVLLDGSGDVQARLHGFKLAFRSKLNNWWTTNAPKVTS